MNFVLLKCNGLRLFYSVVNVNYFNNMLYSIISKVLRYLLVEHGNLGMHIKKDGMSYVFYEFVNDDH